MFKAVRAFVIVLACALFSVSVWAGVIGQQGQQAADASANLPTGSTQFAILVSTIAGIASLLATQLFQIYRESRTRKWDLADRASARAEMRKSAEDQRVETIKTAIELAKVSHINNLQLLGAIDENTKITATAVDKADNFNAKLEALHQELANFQKSGGSETQPKES